MPIYMTKKTYEKFQKRLQDIQKEKYSVAKDLQIAASYGDLSENAEYDAAKERKEMLAIEELKIRERLANVALIEEMDLPDNIVTIGKKVRVLDKDTGEEMEFAILGEFDEWEGIEVISINAPLAKGLLNTKVGRTAEVKLPKSVKYYKVLSVEKLFK